MLAAGLGQGLAEGYRKGQEIKQNQQSLDQQKDYYKALSANATAQAKLHEIEAQQAQQKLTSFRNMLQANLMPPEQALYTSPTPNLRQGMQAGGPSFQESMQGGQAALDDLQRTTSSSHDVPLYS